MFDICLIFELAPAERLLSLMKSTLPWHNSLTTTLHAE